MEPLPNTGKDSAGDLEWADLEGWRTDSEVVSYFN